MRRGRWTRTGLEGNAVAPERDDALNVLEGMRNMQKPCVVTMDSAGMQYVEDARHAADSAGTAGQRGIRGGPVPVQH